MNTTDKILVGIADDHTLLRRGLADLIDSFGPFKVIAEANNGKELIASFHQLPLAPDICILDINMPELDGYNTLLQMRQLWPEIKVLALSMYNSEFTIIRMLRAGANGYLLKNCHPNQFKTALEHIYEFGFYESELTERNNQHIAGNNTATITPKELEFLSWCCSELVYKEIADKMGISPRTVEDYRDNLFRKLKVNTRTGLAMYAIKAGIVMAGM